MLDDALSTHRDVNGCIPLLVERRMSLGTETRGGNEHEPDGYKESGEDNDLRKLIIHCLVDAFINRPRPDHHGGDHFLLTFWKPIEATCTRLYNGLYIRARHEMSPMSDYDGLGWGE